MENFLTVAFVMLGIGAALVSLGHHVLLIAGWLVYEFKRIWYDTERRISQLDVIKTPDKEVQWREP